MLYLYSTLELVAFATTNSHYVFCFCNFIIFVLLIGSNPPPLTDSNPEIASEEEPIKDQSPVVEAEDLKEGQKVQEHQDDDDDDAELEVGITANQDKEKVPEQEEDDVDNDEEEEEEEDEEVVQEQDDELRRRIEQFIEKINREWKAEKLRTRQQDRMKTSYNVK